MENTKKIPILIYVTKAKPYLSLDLNPQRKTYGLYRLCKHPDPSKDGEDDQDLNGLVCFEGDCKEAYLIKNECNLGTCHGFRLIGLPDCEAFKRSGEIVFLD